MKSLGVVVVLSLLSASALAQDVGPPPRDLRERVVPHHTWALVGIGTVSVGLALDVAGLGTDIAFIAKPDPFDKDSEGPLPGVGLWMGGTVATLTGALITIPSLEHEARVLRRHRKVSTACGWAGFSLLVAGSALAITEPIVGPEALGAPSLVATSAGLVLVGVQAAQLLAVRHSLPEDVQKQMERRRVVEVSVVPTFRNDGGGVAVVGTF